MKNPLDRIGPGAPIDTEDVNEKSTTDKEAGVTTGAEHGSTTAETDRDSDEISLDAQTGVQRIEAMTKAWTRRDLYLAYIT